MNQKDAEMAAVRHELDKLKVSPATDHALPFGGAVSAFHSVKLATPLVCHHCHGVDHSCNVDAHPGQRGGD